MAGAAKGITEMSDIMRWGVLGAAKFAREHMAPAIHAAKGAQFTALATSSAEKAAPFQAFQPELRIHDSYEALLADPDIDAVYIPLPNHMHVEWATKAAQARKHVLCEKPIAGMLVCIAGGRELGGRIPVLSDG